MVLPTAPDPHRRRAAVRVSDADRDAAAGVLRDFYGEGRLDLTELQNRLALALVARMTSDLDALFVDLPAAVPLPVPREGRRSHRRRELVAAVAAGVALTAAGWVITTVRATPQVGSPVTATVDPRLPAGKFVDVACPGTAAVTTRCVSPVAAPNEIFLFRQSH